MGFDLIWVPEGSLAQFFRCIFEVWLAPGEAFKNVGGEAPHIFEGFPGPPGPARSQKCIQQIRPDCLQIPS